MKADSAPYTSSDRGPARFLDRDKVEALYEEFYKIAEEKIGADYEGDLPIDIRIIDRTRYERMHFRPVPYDMSVVTEIEHDSVLSALMTNLGLATEQINRWHRCLEYNPRPSTATDENLASENRALVERNKTIDGELDVMRREHAVQIRKDEIVKGAREKRNQATEALDHLWHCKVDDCAECEAYKVANRLEGKRPPKKTRKKS